MPILNLKNKTKKYKSNSNSIYHSFGEIGGTLNSYKNKLMTAERALDDIKDIIEYYELLKTKDNNE